MATLGWNGDRHLAAWYGVAGIGAVLHTLNPRLFLEQIASLDGVATLELWKSIRGSPSPHLGTIAWTLELIAVLLALLYARLHRRGAATAWLGMIHAAFLAGYDAAIQGSRAAVTDPGTHARLLRLSLLTKALYEVDYEVNNRPDWIEIPARGVLTILDEAP